MGDNFDLGPNALQVTLGNFGSLVISFADPNLIVVGFPEGLVPADYLLTVSSGPGPRKNDDHIVTVGATGPEGPEGAEGQTGQAGPPGVWCGLRTDILAAGQSKTYFTQCNTTDTYDCPPDHTVAVSGACGDSGGGQRVVYSGPDPAVVQPTRWACRVANTSTVDEHGVTLGVYCMPPFIQP